MIAQEGCLWVAKEHWLPVIAWRIADRILFDDNTEEEVKKLNSELEELQKCLLNGAADLDLVMENKLTTKL